MAQVITATFEDGVLKPDGKLDLAPGSKVRLVVESPDLPIEDDPLDELDRLCDEFPITSTTPRLTRDQLYDRR
ncbi:MAG: antitoxin family protein [Gemmataceae bacterium]|nr:antitoxin family protein [Gemmataceae bacterium]